MASTSQLSTWPVITTSVDTSTTRPTYSPALNLLAAVATADIREYTLIEIGIRNMDNVHSMDKRQVGRGGFAVVELGNTDENRIVAVKRIRISGKDAQTDFGNHLQHLCLELQILCHEPLKGHPNIINILGYCLSEIVGFEVPFLALVLEYSSEGTLKAFLCDNQYSLSITTLVDLAAQVAAGLEALHQCNICHGDIKTQNALVFRNEDTWTVKLSDFGGSVVGRSDDPSLPVGRGFGTRLMNAPEIRSDMARTNAHFTIDDAIRTDVFSFGLLTWEVMKQGSSYYDKEWCAEVEGSIDVDEMEEYLEKLPHNGLLSKACDYVKSNLCGNEMLELILWTFQNSLQDDPTKRCSMKEIRERLESQNPPILMQNSSERHTIAYEPLCAWSTRDTLFELRAHAYHNGVGLIALPFELQKRIALDLMSMSESEAFAMPSRVHAAMCVAECYSSGFGVTHDKNQVAQWIYRASELGSLKAAAWYPRICSANNIAPIRSSHLQASFDFEANLVHFTSDAYLSNRIQLQIRIAIQHIKTTILAQNQLLSFDPSGYVSRFGLFNGWELDDLLPLHLAALLGDDVSVSILLCRQEGDVSSSQGFTAIHYACVGGHLSTLQLLLRHFSITNAADVRGITPLHLCVFFVGDDAGKAASLLLDSGNDPNAKVLEHINWEYHDISLVGTALDWATRTRHRSLVHSLLPFAKDDSCLSIAVGNFFWDIAEIILQYSRGTGNIPVKFAQELSELSTAYQYLATLVSPFAHWIAHGPDHLIAMERTVQTGLGSHIVASGNAQHVALKDIVNGATFEDDFALIVFCATNFPSEDVKRTNENGDSALALALVASADSHVWQKPLEAIVSVYTIEELEAGSESPHMLNQSYLHHAIHADSVIGTRLLLEKGMDANQRTFGVFGETPLALTGYSKFSNEFYSLLIGHGARDDVTDDFSGENFLAYHLLDSQPNEELLRGVLGNKTSPHTGNALHITLTYVVLGPSLADAILEMDERIDVIHERNRSSTIKLGKDELEFLWSQLENLTGNKTSELELVLGKEQLSSLLGYMSLDSKQRPTSLDLTVHVGEMEALCGVDEVQRVLSQDGAVSTWASEELQLAETRHGHGGASDLEDLSLALDSDKPNRYWEELFKLQLGLDNWVKSINNTDKSGKTLIQRAAYHLHLRSVTLLLEAGADASIPLAIEGHDAMLPLQIACAVGRACQGTSLLGGHPALITLGKYSMEVASELLQWHYTRSDGLFRGITKFHLACRMLMPGKIAEIADDPPSVGYYKTAKGHWPGIHSPVGWEDLAVQIADDEWLFAFHPDDLNTGTQAASATSVV